VYLVHWGWFVPGTGLMDCTRYTGQPAALGAWLDWGDLSQARFDRIESGSIKRICARNKLVLLCQEQTDLFVPGTRPRRPPLTPPEIPGHATPTPRFSNGHTFYDIINPHVFSEGEALWIRKKRMHCFVRNDGE
jgi:hypothetical protein